jgi:hypothetical protein
MHFSNKKKRRRKIEIIIERHLIKERYMKKQTQDIEGERDLVRRKIKIRESL